MREDTWLAIQMCASQNATLCVCVTCFYCTPVLTRELTTLQYQLIIATLKSVSHVDLYQMKI